MDPVPIPPLAVLLDVNSVTIQNVPSAIKMRDII